MKKCKLCNKRFEPNSRTQLYCLECRKIKEYEWYLTSKKNERRKKELSKTNYEKEDKRLNGSLWYGLWNLGYTDKEISEICNTKITRISSWRNYRNIPRNKRVVEIKCSYCNNKIIVEKHKLKNNTNNFCDRRCWRKWIKENLSYMCTHQKRRKESPKWIGDKSLIKVSLNEYIRKMDIYLKWRTNVFERDNYICQVCGNRGRELNAHHIIPLTEIILKNKLNNISNMEELDLIDELWNIENGITLCKTCHINIHHKNCDEGIVDL